MLLRRRWRRNMLRRGDAAGLPRRRPHAEVVGATIPELRARAELLRKIDAAIDGHAARQRGRLHLVFWERFREHGARKVEVARGHRGSLQKERWLTAIRSRRVTHRRTLHVPIGREPVRLRDDGNSQIRPPAVANNSR